MYWADKVAEELKQRNKPLEWVDDMKTPSGKIHVGALRGVVIHDVMYKALKDHSVNSKYTYIFDNHDPMDGLPVYLPKDEYEQYMGLPLYKVPSPEKGYVNYAEYYAKDFIEVFQAIGCEPEILWSTDLYMSGKMNPVIKLALDNAAKIRKIYEEMYKKSLADNWYPFQVYCTSCGKVSTTKVTDWNGEEITFSCNVDQVDWTKGCGASGKVSPFSNEKGIAGKLPWKIEWSAKWKVLGVTVEGAGKDHMSRGGSHDLTSIVSREIFDYEVPYPLGYEFFLVGGKKMSSSKGLGSSARDMLDMLPPQLLRFLMVKTKLNQTIDFDPSGFTIPNLFDEYQKAAESYYAHTGDDIARMFEFSQIGKTQTVPSVRFSVLAQWVQMPNMEDSIEKEGLSEWAQYAKIWVEKYAPDSEKFVIQKSVPESAKNLSDLQKKYLEQLVQKLENTGKAEDFQVELYNLSKELGIESKEAFAAIYSSLLGKDHGPKAAWLIFSLDKEFVKKRFEEVASFSSKESSQKGNTVIQQFNNTQVFSISSAVKEKFPSMSIGIATIRGVSIEKKNEKLEKEKEDLLASFSGLTTEQLGDFLEVTSYRKLYKEMGIDWHSRRPSPEALLRRVALNKGLYTINTCVDAYNLIVMKNRVSIGAFDLDSISFPTEVRFPNQGEEILLLGDEAPTQYKEIELAYFDQRGGFNIDFNYRDAQRTAVQLETQNIYVNVDGIFDVTPQMVERSLKEATEKIIEYCGGTVEEFGVTV